MTSWVADDESRRVTGPTRSQVIPQELPYGTSAQAFGLRNANAPTGRMQAQVLGQMLGEVEDARSFDLGRAMAAVDYGESAPSETLGDEFDSTIIAGRPSAEFEYEESTGTAKLSKSIVTESPPPPPPPRSIAPMRPTPAPQREAQDKSAVMKRPRPTEAAPMPAMPKPAPESKVAIVAKPPAQAKPAVPHAIAPDTAGAMVSAPEPLPHKGKRPRRVLAPWQYWLVLAMVIAALLWWLLK
jgi:hypothetical protein